jgi:hypothetical protein
MYELRHHIEPLPKHFKLEVLTSCRLGRQTDDLVFWENIASYKVMVRAFNYCGMLKQAGQQDVTQ